MSKVLLGKLSSDPIEKRFGQFGQLSGANFFILVRQLLDAQKANPDFISYTRWQDWVY